jgi:hypothetical protein
MRIEIEGPQGILEEFRLYLQDQLLKEGFIQGPKIDSVETGLMIEYLRGDQIVSVEISSEVEGKSSRMHLEANKNIPSLSDIWDDSLITYGKQSVHRLLAYAQNKDKVKKGLGQ